MMARSRPPSKAERFTPDQIVAAIQQARGLVTVAARKAGCSTETIRTYCGKYPQCAAALEEARNTILDTGEQKLFDAVERGEQWAIVFLLTRLGKSRGYTERHELEHTGAGGGAIILQWADAEDAK